ncbi:UTRA domain-containing protein [Pseudooceanicola spongiae]|uniref:UTRA domain-containing protein n=2 Tax=Pseudooceanicola spongiae TaxID=2613965 RepID=A0A7M3V2V5_9RHOB|nr:UTRA domain-containing protein [Pseudooceanicola spongiae]
MRNAMTLSRNAGQPYYLQIADKLRDLIETMPAGGRLPSEPKLAKQFSVSRFTVAKAVEQLTRDNLIVRKQGSGTFVAEAPLRRQPGYLLSFTEAVSAAGRTASHKLLRYEAIPWQADLPYEAGEDLILLDRLRFVDDMPVARHRSILSAALLEEIGLTRDAAEAADFSLYRHFADHGLSVTTGEERLIARIATPEEHAMLKLSDDPVVISVIRRTYSDEGRLLDAVDATYDAKRYSYEARLTRQPEKTKQNPTDQENDHDTQSNGSDGHNGPRLGPWHDDGGTGR